MKKTIAAIVTGAVLVLGTIASVVTHMVYCIGHKAWGLAILGMVVPPYGVLHGVGLWFGWWS